MAVIVKNLLHPRGFLAAGSGTSVRAGGPSLTFQPPDLDILKNVVMFWVYRI